MMRLASATLACAVIAFVPPASAETYKMLSSWDRALKPAYTVAEMMQKQVEEVSGGKTKLEISGPETVPPFQQLQPVASGVFDILYTHGAYHAGAKGIAMAGDAIDGDPAKRRSSGVWKFIDEYYQKSNGLKLVSMPVQSSHGYQFYLRAPLSPAGDWAGRKIRGVVSYHGVIRALGGVPVVIPVPEVYSALEKGVVDGACLTANGMLDIKHHEVAKVRIEPTFGVTTTIIAVNLAKWNKAPEADRTALLAAGEKLEIEAPKRIDAMLMEERAELARLGIKVETLSPEKSALIKKAWNDSQWELAKQCCGEAADELKAIATKAGITN
jgi:TRAP-type transport system periplasmic protein